MLYQFLLVQLVMELTEVLPRLVAALTVTSITASQIAWLAAINAPLVQELLQLAAPVKEQIEAQNLPVAVQTAISITGFPIALLAVINAPLAQDRP